MDPFDTPSGSQDTVPQPGRRRRRSGRRRKTARHASCDEKKPVCSNCERLSLHCQPSEFIIRSAWCPTTDTAEQQPAQEVGVARNDSDPAPSSSPDTSRRNTSPVPSIFPASNEPAVSRSSSSPSAPSPHSAGKPAPRSISTEVAHLLSVYSTGVATWMDVFDHAGSYHYEVPRRCLTSELLTSCVCAFTAKQLSLVSPGAIWSVPAARYYGDALRLLIQHLDSSPGATPGDSLTANMLLSSYEMLEDHGYEHQRHLRGAATLIKMQGINANSQGMDKANFWIFVRHDITIALENESPLYFSPKDWHVKWDEDETGEDVLGNRLMWLVARAIDYTYAPDRPASPDNTLQVIHSETVAWLDNLPPSFQGVKYGNADTFGLGKTYFAVPTAGGSRYSRRRDKKKNC
ncbi:C6 zinc finger domain protein [Seiridium cupressi]